MIPGMNLLDMAFTVISQQSVLYARSTGRTLNVNGHWVTTYATPITITGSFQPVPRSMYEKYGLDFQKVYYTFYTSNNVKDLQRNVSGDQITFNNQLFQCESNNDWFAQDGWLGVLCVLQPAVS